jgi:hypothetical protein
VAVRRVVEEIAATGETTIKRCQQQWKTKRHSELKNKEKEARRN